MRRLDMTVEWNVLKEHLDVGCGSYPKLLVHFWHIALLFWILFVGTLIELRSSYLPFVCFEYLVIFWMFYHINWFKKISTNRTWIVDCSRSFPPDSRCSSMPMSPMAMCQLLCGAGEGFQYTNSAFPFGTSAFPKNLACEIFNFCSYISAHIFLETSSLFGLYASAFRNNKTGTHRTHRQKTSKAWKTTVTLSKNASVLRQLFGDGFGWMWPPESQVFVYLWPSPKKTWWFQRFLHVYTQDLRKWSTNMSKTWVNTTKENIETFDWKTLMFKNCRDEGLAEALANGLLRPHGVVATNFLPHVDLVLSSRIKTTTSLHVSQQIHSFVCWGSSSGGLRQCLSFKARNQFFNSGSGALKKLNFTFFVVVSLYISVNIVVGGLFWENHGGGC